MSEPIITFDKVNKWYGNNFHVLRDIELQLSLIHISEPTRPY